MAKLLRNVMRLMCLTNTRRKDSTLYNAVVVTAVPILDFSISNNSGYISIFSDI